jgi:hypothetical protein
VNSKNSRKFPINVFRINGKEIFVKLNETTEEAKRLKKGAVITVKHSGTNVYGTLQYPQYYRERVDVQWKEMNKVP